MRLFPSKKDFADFFAKNCNYLCTFVLDLDVFLSPFNNN
jgi:hypothetical protein